MPAIRPRRRQPAYTLLELILAMAIGILLLAGLYLALTTTLGQQSIGRGAAQQSALVRDLLSRIERDITCHLAPLDPKLNSMAVQLSSGTTGGSSSSTSSSSGSTSGGSTGGTTSASSGGSSGSSTTSSGTAGLSFQSPNPAGPVVFNLGLQGSATQLTLYVTKVPSEAYWSSSTSQVPVVVSDLRRVSYWLAGAGTNLPLGLARQELPVATTVEALTLFDPTQVKEQDFVIAPDVLDLSFEYFDGTQWQDSWDGTVLQSDGKTPQGPPAAVAINLTIRKANATTPDQTMPYRHVVALPTANNFVTTATDSSTSSSSSTGSSMSGTVP